MAQARTPLPIEFASRVRDVIIKARFHGADAAEALNYKGLLLTPAEERGIRVRALQRFQDELSRWQPHEMLRRKFNPAHTPTPAEMYVVIQEFLDELIQDERTRTW